VLIFVTGSCVSIVLSDMGDSQVRPDGGPTWACQNVNVVCVACVVDRELSAVGESAELVVSVVLLGRRLCL